LEPPPWLTAVAIAIFTVLTFIPVTFVHPWRVRARRPVTMTLLVLWGVLAIAAVVSEFEPGVLVNTGLCAIAAYFLFAGLLPQQRTA
jgi:phosphatidylcholine synthase